LVVLLGCGSSSGDKPISVSQMINQLTGGEVKIGSSGAAFTIPPGSLVADTTITANAAAATSAVPAHETVKGLLYDMGPDGTTFDPPATLTLPSPHGTPPAGATMVVSMLANGEWTDLETTTTGAGTVSAQIAHFTGFAVRWVTRGAAIGDGGPSSSDDDGGVSTRDGGGPISADGGVSVADPCSGIPSEACGGDLVADWKPSIGCFVGEMLKGCDEASKFSYDVKVMGEASFKADMSYSLDLPYTVTGRAHASSACLTLIELPSCEEMQAQLRLNEEVTFPTLWQNATCTGTAATGCDCTSTATGSFAMPQTGTYATEGSTFTTTATDQEPSNVMPYCVNGNKLWVQVPTESNEPEYLVFTK
jgi:hypothetical protein